jgi:uncharacterized membrane protein (UPF0127 family)
MIRGILMTLPRWHFPDFRSRLAPRQTSTPDNLMLVLNLTRHTQLAASVEVAASGATRAKGLLGRKGLAPGTGMWIVPCEAVHTFGMQFAIDLVYLDRKHRVRKVRSNVGPWRLSGCLTAHSVIELAAGAARQALTERGDLLEFSPATPESAPASRV